MSSVKTNISSDLFEAAKAAQQLNQFLLNAATSTGGLDLSKFNASLQQSGMELKDYANRLIAIGPQGEEAFLRVAAAIGRAETPLIRTSSLMDQLWITMKNTMRWQITSSALQGFIGSLQTAYGYAQDLNESLTNIRIVTERSAEDMANFAKQANESAKALSTTTTDYTDAALIYYQQGLSEQEVIDRTETTIKMANAAGVSAQTASDQLTAVWNNFYDGSKSLEYYADVMVRLGADTASSTDEISEGIQQFASVADTVGLSYEYAASALATVTATTRESADIVGTAFRTLFARIQGLNLGETLDDGTTLNKYSQALEKVGIDIFDVNGEIKTMDTLLDEMGAKWNTLSNDQQIALAQTVAGVRQYTRLIALMDNWDFFQENLASAYGSEGSLQEQADIYAESWEAARDRVTAAAEDIYDSVFNPDLFIAIDDTITPLLGGIADVTDALGGLPGILNIVGSFMTSAFSDKISKSIRDMAYNINLLRGNITKIQNDMRTDAGNIALSLARDSARAASSNSNIATEQGYTIAKTQIQSEDIMLQNTLSSQARLMTEEQQKQLSAYKDIIAQIKLIGLEQARNAATEKDHSDVLSQQIIQQEQLIKSTISYQNTLRGISSLLEKNGIIIPGLDVSKNISSVNTMVQSFKQLSVASGQIEQIQVEMKALADDGIKTSAVVDNLKKRFQQLTGINISNSSMKDSLQVIGDTAIAVADAIGRLQTSLRNNTNFANDEELQNFINRLQQLGDTARQVGASLESSKYSTDTAAQETEKYLLSVYNATLKQRDWAFTIVTTANQLMNLGLVFSSIQNLVQTLNNEDLTFGEKMISILTSIGMIAPQVVSAIQLINQAKTSYATITVAGITATDAEILSQYAATAASNAHAKSKVVETKAVEGNTVAVIANTTALKANPIFWIIATITAVVAAFSAYTSAVEENTKKQIENAKATAEASQADADAVKEERDNIASLYQEYIDLRSRIDESSQVKEDLKEKTEELCAALDVEWDALDKLQGKYDEVNKEIAEANRRTILESIDETNEAIKDTQYSIARQAAEYDSSMATSEGYEGLAYTVDFGAGFSGADEQEIKQLIEDTLVESGYDGIITTGANAGIQIHAENAEQIIQMYELISQAVNTVMEDLDENTRNESEVFQNAYEWVRNYSTEYDKIVQYQKDLANYAEQLAEAEAAVTGYDLADVTTYEEYSQYEDQYIQRLRESYEKAGILTNEMTEEYFRDIARKYLSEYSNLADQIAEADVADAILQEVGEENRDKVQEIIDSGNYDLSILGNLQWSFIFNQEDVDIALEEQYNKVKARIDAANFEELLPQVNSIMSDLSEGNDLTEDQITQLGALESEYIKLASIRDRGSAQYIQALRDIREGMENVISTNAMNELQDAWDQLAMISKEGSTRRNQIIGVDLDDADFQENMKAILDADYAVQVAIEADLKSDVDDVLDYASAIQQATSLIQEGFKVSYDDIDALTAVFPGILAGYTTTADGMIQLNSEIAQSSIDLASTQIAADRDAARQNIESYQQVLLAKAAAMRLIAEGLWELTQTSEDNADAQAKIDEGITNFKSACADEQNLISKGLAESEIDDSNQIMAANENAAGTSANNWANAYDSMAKNSAEWARIAIANANAVAKAMKGAEEGRVVKPEVTSGGIASSYAGTTEDYVYSGTYESRGQDNVDWFDYYESGDYRAAYEAAIQQAEGYEQAAATLSGMLAKLDGAASTVDNLVNTVGRDTSGSDSNDEGTVYDPEAEKTLEDIEDRYHEINREIEDQNSLLEDVGNNIERAYGNRRLQAYEKELQELNKQQENYNKKLAEAETYLDFDRTNLQSLFGNSLIFDKNGEIQGYQQVLQSMIDDYNNNFLADYNAFLAEFSTLTKAEQEARQAEYDSWQQQKTVADELFQKRQDALAQYEDTLDTIQEIRDSQEEIARNIADNRLSQIEYKLEVVLDVKEAKDAVLELTRDIAESFGDMLTHGIQSTNIGWEEALGNMNVIDDYYDALNSYQNELANATDATDIARIMDNLADLQSQAISTADALLEWVESLETLLPDALDDASERFAQFTDQLEHNESVLGLIEELYALQGVTYKTQEGFDQLQRVGKETMEAQVAQAQLHRSWYENSRQELLEAQAALDALGGDETDPAYDGLKANRDALLEEFNEAQEAMLSSAQAAMETAQEIYTQAIERAVYEFGQTVSGGVGLDLLQDKFDHYIDQEGRYLDTVNEAYEVASWYNKLQEDIDKTTNSKLRDQLKNLQEEIDLRRENNTLSEYDLEILEAKYNVLQAQIALEDAQNAKNELRLVRDRQGNWNYQYTADPSQIADAEQNLLDAENEWYNIAKQQVEDVTGEIISTWQECQSAIEEIYNDMSLTDEERAARAEEIYAYYTQKIQDLENEKQVAIADMTEAGNKSLFDMAVVAGDEVSDLTGITSQEIQDIIANSGMSIIELLMADNEQIKDIVGSNTQLIDLFDNVFAKDLANMTANAGNFEDYLSQAMSEAEGAMTQYQDTVSSVADETGTNLDDLSGYIDDVSTSTDICRDAGLEATEMMWDQIDAIHDLSQYYLNLADSIYEYIEALRDLARETAQTMENEANRTDDLPSATIPDRGDDSGSGGTGGNGSGIGQTGGGNGIPEVGDEVTYLGGWYYHDSYGTDPAGKRGPGKKVRITRIVKGNPYPIHVQSDDSAYGWLKESQISGFDTGGYTGEFDNAKLAFLHEKELVLNQEDTKNILSAVSAMRALGPEFIASIESALDNNALSAKGLMASRLGNNTQVAPANDTIEQRVTIEHVEFPNVTSSDEIQDALRSLVDDAAQWANRRKG